MPVGSGKYWWYHQKNIIESGAEKGRGRGGFKNEVYDMSSGDHATSEVKIMGEGGGQVAWRLLRMGGDVKFMRLPKRDKMGDIII